MKTLGTMKAIINETGKKIFKNQSVIKLYNDMSERNHIIEHGKDNKGNIYFHWANGNTDRYSRKEFIKMAKEVL